MHVYGTWHAAKPWGIIDGGKLRVHVRKGFQLNWVLALAPV